MPVAAKRVFRLSLTVALSLAGAYAMGGPLPYMAPLFALFLSLNPSPPMGFKKLLALVLLILITTGIGLLIVPVLIHYPLTGFLIVAAGLFLSNDLSINRGQAAVGGLLTMGLTLISAEGVASFPAALVLAKTLALAVGLAVFCQWLVYPFFPEDPRPAGPPAKPTNAGESSSWTALRATLIVLPTYFIALTNPSMYLSIVMKAVSLGQQGSITNARQAGRELLSSTFLGGCFAVLFWFALKLDPSLWMFFLWMLLFGIYFASKLFGVLPSRFPPSVWVNVVVTMLILVGPAVEDSAGGKDVYKAFAVRMGLFVAVTLYAWGAILVLEYLKKRRQPRVTLSLTTAEVPSC